MTLKEVDLATAIGRKFPEHIAMVVSVDKDNNPNIMPTGRARLVTNRKPLLCIIVVDKDRYTYDLISDSKEFCMCYPSRRQREDVLFCGTHSGRSINKLELTKLKMVPSTKLRTPLIDDSVACFECKLRAKVDVGIHTIFIGEILAGHVSEYTEKLYSLCTWPVKGANGFKTISEISNEDIKESISSSIIALKDAKELKNQKDDIPKR
ncbi:MAG: flavin reductase family protein [Candidatus Heimdallarchaeaceae archaeon]